MVRVHWIVGGQFSINCVAVDGWLNDSRRLGTDHSGRSTTTTEMFWWWWGRLKVQRSTFMSHDTIKQKKTFK